jgi:hypothetical protein
MRVPPTQSSCYTEPAGNVLASTNEFDGWGRKFSPGRRGQHLVSPLVLIRDFLGVGLK